MLLATANLDKIQNELGQHSYWNGNTWLTFDVIVFDKVDKVVSFRDPLKALPIDIS